MRREVSLSPSSTSQRRRSRESTSGLSISPAAFRPSPSIRSALELGRQPDQQRPGGGELAGGSDVEDAAHRRFYRPRQPLVHLLAFGSEHEAGPPGVRRTALPPDERAGL